MLYIFYPHRRWEKKKKAGVVGASLSAVLHSQFLCMLTWQVSLAMLMCLLAGFSDHWKALGPMPVYQGWDVHLPGSVSHPITDRS